MRTRATERSASHPLVLGALLALGIAGLGAQAALAAATVYVYNASPSCSDSGPGTLGSPYCTISAALAAHHAPGDLILVLPGIYREQIDVPGSGTSGSPITLQGQGSAGSPVVVDGADDLANPALWLRSSGNVWLAASVTWSPNQVFADSARLVSSASAPTLLPANSFRWVQGAGLYVNVGGDNPGVHHAEAGRRSFGFHATGRAWVTIDGFTVTRSEFAGIEVDGSSSDIAVTNDIATFSSAYGIQADSCTAVTIGSNVTSDDPWSGIALTGGSTGCTVEDNESFRNPTPNLSCGIYAYGAPGNLIQRNRLHHNAYNGVFLLLGSTNNVLLQNQAWKNGHQGIEDIHCPGNTHIGDVSYDNISNGFAIEGGATGTTLYDCVAIENGQVLGTADLEVDAQSTTGFTSNDNLFWNSALRAVVKFGATAYNTVAAFSAASGQDTRTLQADPKFANAPAGDFRPMAGSPLIDSGNSGVPGWPATDAADNPRSDDPATANTGLGPVPYADRGAFEFQPGDPPPPPVIVPATYYVNGASPACSDLGPGTLAAPYCTISGALAAQNDPGTTIVVLPGVYREQVTVPASGVAGYPIVLQGQGAPGSPVVVSGADDFASPALWAPYAGSVWLAASVTWSPRQVFADSAQLAPSAAAPSLLPAGSFTWVQGAGLYVNVGGDNPGLHHAEVGDRSFGFHVSGAAWIVIDGFTATRGEFVGIELDAGSSNVTVTHDAATFSDTYGIQADGSSGVTIGSSVASDNEWSGIALTGGSTGCVVQDDESFHNLAPGLAAGIYVLGAPANLVQRNRVHDNALTGLHLQGAAGLVSLQNRSWNNGADGFHDVGTTGAEHVGDVAFGNFRDGFGLDSGSGTRLADCIATVNGLDDLGHDLRVDSTATSGLSSDDNLFWNPSGFPPVLYRSTSYATVAAYSAATGHDTRTLQADPRFADPWSGDLRLTWGSPAIDAANSGVPGWPATDAGGGPRLDDPATANTGLGPVAYADRGALEYVPGPQPQRVAVPPMDHVIVVVLENQSFAAARTAPYVAGLLATQASCSSAYAITHPSQPNYFALWAGSTEGLATDDCPPAGAPYSGENLGHAGAAIGLTWRSYAENLPAAGSTVCSASPTAGGPLYTRDHSPWVSFSNVNHANEQPYTQLAADIAAGKLPNLAIVTPNNCHNGHNAGCPLDTTNAWLAREVPAMLTAVGPHGMVVLVWDEDDGESGDHVLAVLAGPLVKPGFASSRFVNHYTLLRTIGDALGIAPFGAAAAESPISDVWSPSTAAVRDPSGTGPTGATVGPGRPNPFRGAIRVALSVPARTIVSAEIYDLAGRRVRALAPAVLSGAAEIRWDGRREDGGEARPGVYLMRVRAGDAVFARRLVRLE